MPVDICMGEAYQLPDSHARGAHEGHPGVLHVIMLPEIPEQSWELLLGEYFLLLIVILPFELSLRHVQIRKRTFDAEIHDALALGAFKRTLNDGLEVREALSRHIET